MATPVPLPRSTPLSWLRDRPPLTTRLDAAIRTPTLEPMDAQQATSRLYAIHEQLRRTRSTSRMADLFVAAAETYVSAPRDVLTDLAMGHIEADAEAATQAGRIADTPFTALIRDYARDPNPAADAAPLVSGNPEDVLEVLDADLVQKQRLLTSITKGTRHGLAAQDELAERISRTAQPSITVHDALAADNENLDELLDSLKVGEVDAAYAASVAATVHAKWGGVADAIVERAERVGAYATTEAPFTVADFPDLAASRQHRELQHRDDEQLGLGWDASRNTISRGFVTQPAGVMLAAIRQGVAEGTALQAERHATGMSGERLSDAATESALVIHEYSVEATFTDAAAEVEFIDHGDRLESATAIAREAGKFYAAWSGVDDNIAANAADLGGVALRQARPAELDDASSTATFRTHANAAIAEQVAADPQVPPRREELRARLDTAFPAPATVPEPPRVETRMERSVARAPWKPYQPAPAPAAFAATGVPPRGADLNR